MTEKEPVGLHAIGTGRLEDLKGRNIVLFNDGYLLVMLLEPVPGHPIHYGTATRICIQGGKVVELATEEKWNEIYPVDRAFLDRQNPDSLAKMMGDITSMRILQDGKVQ
jgi:hypothetical protein